MITFQKIVLQSDSSSPIGSDSFLNVWESQVMLEGWKKGDKLPCAEQVTKRFLKETSACRDGSLKNQPN